MNLTHEEILLILKILKDSEFDELDLKIGSLTMKARRKGAAGAISGSISGFHDPGEPGGAAPPVAGDTVDAEPKKDALPQDSQPEEGLLAITAPTLGTFYRRPSPEEPPFVEVGQLVKEEDTVCIVEVMKVFSTVKAGISGRIHKICAESGELVEFGQVLFLVKPGTDSQMQGTE